MIQASVPFMINGGRAASPWLTSSGSAWRTMSNNLCIGASPIPKTACWRATLQSLRARPVLGQATLQRAGLRRVVQLFGAVGELVIKNHHRRSFLNFAIMKFKNRAFVFFFLVSFVVTKRDYLCPNLEILLNLSMYLITRQL